MGLPDVLTQAGVELLKADTAWTAMRVAAEHDDEIDLRQFADETLYAVKRAACLLDEWFTFGDTPHVDDDSEGCF